MSRKTIAIIAVLLGGCTPDCVETECTVEKAVCVGHRAHAECLAECENGDMHTFWYLTMEGKTYTYCKQDAK